MLRVSGLMTALMVMAQPAAAGEPMVLTDEQLDQVTAGALVAVLGGEATAIGADTLATGDLDLTVTDRRNRTLARGTVKMTAAANSPTGEVAYVSAETFAYAQGADIVIIRMKTVTNPDETMAISVTKLHAIDLKRVDFENPIVVTATKSLVRRGGRLIPNGNVATMDFNVSANGPNTVAEVQTSVLAVQKALSTTAINVLAGAGS